MRLRLQTEQVEDGIEIDWNAISDQLKAILIEENPTIRSDIEGLRGNDNDKYKPAWHLDVIRFREIKVAIKNWKYLCTGNAYDIFKLWTDQPVLKTVEVEVQWEKLANLAKRALAENTIIIANY